MLKTLADVLPYLSFLQVTVYAAYLYDAVYLYARAADKVVKEKKNITDGTAIMEKIRGTSYNSKFCLSNVAINCQYKQRTNTN